MNILNQVAEVVDRPENIGRAFLLVITKQGGVQYRGTVVGDLEKYESRYLGVELQLWTERGALTTDCHAVGAETVDGPTGRNIFIAASAIETVEIEWFDGQEDVAKPIAGIKMSKMKRIQRFVAGELGGILLLAVLLFLPASILFEIVISHARPDAAALSFSIGFLCIDVLLVRDFVKQCRSAWVTERISAKKHVGR